MIKGEAAPEMIMRSRYDARLENIDKALMNRGTCSWGDTRKAVGALLYDFHSRGRSHSPIVRRQIETSERTIRIRFFDC